MVHKNAYSSQIHLMGMHAWAKYLALFFLANVIFNASFSQEENQYDEIAVYVEIPRVGSGELPAVIQNETLFLPVIDLFDFLKIKNIPSFELESVSGFFIDPQATYSVSRTDNKIVFKGKTYNLNAGDIVKTETNLYLNSRYFSEVFGLDCKFNFRSLTATITSQFDLPVILELRREEMRKNLTRLKGGFQADTTFDREYHLFKFGMADWSVISSQESAGKKDARLNLSLGAMIAGGEATAAIYYNSSEPFNEKDQYYLWRFVNNDFKPLRQVSVGKISSNAVSSLFNPVIGLQLTNTPTTYRRSFGSYILSDKTEPGWIVELYVNNVLVDYLKADASGFFSFEVPLVYGNSSVRLKFYGPWGEERIKEQNISIPFTFLPVKTFEYTASAGIVQDSSFSRFTRANFNYGVTRRLTVGGGIEYFSGLSVNPAMPFINASFGLTNNLLVSAEYMYKVRTRGTLSYRLPSNMQLDANYTWYDPEQKAIWHNYREERKIALSVPVRIFKTSTFHRFTFNQTILPTTSFSTAEWLFSGSFAGVSTNLTTFSLFTEEFEPSIYTNLSLAFRGPWGFLIMPQLQYQISRNKLVSAKIKFEKPLFEKAYLSLSYEHLFFSKTNLAEIGFRYDFNFAQAGLSVQQFKNKTTLIEYARGSIINDRKTRYLGTDNRTNVGKGAIAIVPYIDLNGNNKMDKGEPKANGLNLRSNGGRIERSEADTIIRIFGLEPYTSCFIELDPNSFENVTWRLKFKTISVKVDPDIIKTIEIPIIAAGEANGYVNLDKDGVAVGQGRIIVNILSESMKQAGRAITEDDGFYSFFGLLPGKYVAQVDTNQLRKLRMTSTPKLHEFTIKGGLDGDIIEGLDFLLAVLPSDSAAAALQPATPEELQRKGMVRKDTTFMIIHEVTQAVQTVTEDSYALQLGAFRKRANADALRRKLEKSLGLPLQIVVSDGFYKVRLPDMKDKTDVDNMIAAIGRKGINEIWLINQKAATQQWVLTERSDTVTQIRQFVPDSTAALTPYLSIQVGAFRRQANALALRDQLAGIGKKVEIVREDGLYKVRITGFTSYDEMERLIPTLGLKDVWKLPIQLPAEAPVLERTLEIRKDTVLVDTTMKVVPVIELPDTARKEVQLAEIPDTAVMKVEIAEKIDTAVLEVEQERERDVPVEDQQAAIIGPQFSLHAAVFNKESQAQRAVNRIQSKLNLPAVIIQQWDFYHVVIPGFYTREETYKYYPELAGMGFTEVYIIEKK